MLYLGEITSFSQIEKIEPIRVQPNRNSFLNMKVYICGVRVDRLSFDRVITKLVEHIHFNKYPAYVVTPNAQHIVIFQNDPEFQKIYDRALLSVPDGVPLLWVAKLMNNPLDGRVNGTDLVEGLCAVSAKEQFKIFFLGGRPQAAKRAAQIMCERYPQLKVIDTYCPPYNFENNEAEIQKIEEMIKTAAPDILFVGLGAPKQEKWIADFHQQLNVPISIGIGGSFELISGMVERAPKWMQQAGLEWLFRLLVEPRRLGGRYLISNTIFIWLVAKQKIGLISSRYLKTDNATKVKR